MSSTTLTAFVALIPTICLILVIILQRRGMRILRTELDARIAALQSLVQADLLLVNERVAKVEGSRIP